MSDSTVSQYAKECRSTIIPALRYRDCHAAIAWLGYAFGFVPQAVYDGPDGTVAHAQLTFGNGMIMVGSASNGGPYAELTTQPEAIGGKSTVEICLIVSDAAAVYAMAKAAGAKITGELAEMPYGGKAFGCLDLEGYLWSIGEYDPWS